MSTDKEKWEWQGKSREQVQFSTLMVGMGGLFVVLFIIYAYIWSILL